MGVLPGEPDPGLTPGTVNPKVTQANIHSTICVSGWTATIRPPSSYTTGLKRTQITASGYSDTKLADYEEDHLISLEIGGNPTDPGNLWPEPYVVTLSDGRGVGARVKDQFENKLHAEVCAGTVMLAAAQAVIARDWIAHWFALDGQAPPPTATASSAPSAEPSTAPASVEPAPNPTATPKPTSAPVAFSVRIVSLTSPVYRNHFATLVTKTRARASCSIDVEYASGASTAAGLGDKTASGTGSVSWTWKVGGRTTRGSWPVTVSCSLGLSSASATRNFLVR